jgi:hypothetical protein
MRVIFLLRQPPVPGVDPRVRPSDIRRRLGDHGCRLDEVRARVHDMGNPRGMRWAAMVPSILSLYRHIR